MANILKMIFNPDKYKSEDEIKDLITNSVSEAVRQNSFQSNANLYSDLDRLQAEDTMRNSISDMTRTADELSKADMIISGQLNGYLSGHTASNVLKSWVKQVTNIDAEVASIIMTILAKSRDLYKNNAIIHRYVQMLVNNVVGTGFLYDMDVLDDKGNKNIELSKYIINEWTTFGKRGIFEVSGNLSLSDVQRIHFTDLPQDGEFLLRIIKDKGINRYSYCVQLIDITRLDYTVNKTFANGSAIVMGIEVNKYGKPLNYYLKTGFEANGYQHEIVPAEEIFHRFIQEYPEQRRAVSWLHAVMMDAKQLAAFREAVIFAARFGASTFATIERDPSATADFATNRDTNGQLFKQIDKGQVVMLNPGEKMNAYTPPFPSNSIDPFMKCVERSIASGLSASYSTLTSDYSESNFAAARLGINEERQDWKTKQQWYIDSFLQVLFSDWLLHCLTNGLFTFNGKKLTVNDFARLNVMRFKGRKWSYIDPTKDLNAMKMALEIGTKSISDAAEELDGTDYEVVFNQKKVEFELAQKLGIPVKQFMDYDLNEAQIEKATAKPEPQQNNMAELQAQRSQDKLDNTLKLMEVTNSIKAEPVPINITNVIRGPGFKTIKTPILDCDGLIVRVEEQDVPITEEEAKTLENNNKGTE